MKKKLTTIFLLLLILASFVSAQDANEKKADPDEPFCTLGETKIGNISIADIKSLPPLPKFAALDLIQIPQSKTVIHDKAAAAKLLGKHKLSLQWISWDFYGTATVRNHRGVYSISGKQQVRDDFVTVDGDIVSIDAKEFKLKGKVVVHVANNNNGEDCVRDGVLTFRITGKRKYWRLMEMQSPCDETTDYVDIYFR